METQTHIDIDQSTSNDDEIICINTAAIVDLIAAAAKEQAFNYYKYYLKTSNKNIAETISQNVTMQNVISSIIQQIKNSNDQLCVTTSIQKLFKLTKEILMLKINVDEHYTTFFKYLTMSKKIQLQINEQLILIQNIINKYHFVL